VALQTRRKLRAEARRDDQIARPIVLGRVQQARIEVGGEEHRPWKARAQCAQHSDLVVDVAAEHADRADLSKAGALQANVLVLDLGGEAAQVIECLGPSAGSTGCALGTVTSPRAGTGAAVPPARDHPVRADN
jgi:hypothetical protein